MEKFALEIGIVDIAVNYVKAYPDELVDFEVLSTCLDLLTTPAYSDKLDVTAFIVQLSIQLQPKA